VGGYSVEALAPMFAKSGLLKHCGRGTTGRSEEKKRRVDGK
jgi:hypothetical protein